LFTPDDFRDSVVREPPDANGLLQTEIRLSTIFVFSRKSFTLFHFTDRATWLL